MRQEGGCLIEPTSGPVTCIQLYRGSEPGLSAALLQSQHPFPLPFLNGSEAVRDPSRRGLAWAVSEHWEVLPIDLGVFNEAFTTAK